MRPASAHARHHAVAQTVESLPCGVVREPLEQRARRLGVAVDERAGLLQGRVDPQQRERLLDVRIDTDRSGEQLPEARVLLASGLLDEQRQPKFEIGVIRNIIAGSKGA